MSNSLVVSGPGSIYAQIIDKIVLAAQNDFEEAALEQETLQELKQTWQQNLSKMHIAQCPWDPVPAQPQIANPPTVPSNVNVKPENPASSAPSQQSRNTGSSSEPHIKQEIKYESGMQAYPPANGYARMNSNTMSAQQRASHLLQEQFGSQANASIQATTGLQQQHQQQQQQQQQQNRSGQPHQRPTHIQMPPQQFNQKSQQQPQYSQQHPNSSLSAAQTDGAEDGYEQWTAVLAERRARHEQDRIAADGMLRAQVEQSAALIDSGLMMPLNELPSSTGKKRKSGRALAMPMPSIAETSGSLLPGIPQMDGGIEEDDKDEIKAKIEADEDAINSDLDDSDDELENPNADDSEGPLGETILCTYDKVQRVKNKGRVTKWKCTLKDGILTTGNKEFVFHKATGEFEW